MTARYKFLMKVLSVILCGLTPRTSKIGPLTLEEQDGSLAQKLPTISVILMVLSLLLELISLYKRVSFTGLKYVK